MFRIYKSKPIIFSEVKMSCLPIDLSFSCDSLISLTAKKKISIFPTPTCKEPMIFKVGL